MSERCPEGWRLVKLGDLGEVNRGRSRYRPRYARHLYGGPYPFVQTGDIKQSGGRITSYEQTYSEAGLAQSRLWPSGTMCITIAANIAETGILTFPACFPDSVVGFVADESKCDIRFVEFMFRNLRPSIQHEATGSVQDNINLQTLGRLRFPLPPLPDQRAIAHILGTLDDKIELNQRMNETLEGIARAIFKSWFVDFDPVRAKAEGREPPGMDDGTAALFPDAFEDLPLGKIPKGWGIATVAEVCSMVTRGVTPQYSPGSGRLIINQRVNRGFELDWSELKELSPDLDVPPEKMARRYDVLVNCLGEGTLGRVHVFVAESDVYAVDQHMSICRPNSPAVGCYLYNVLSSSESQSRIDALKTGTTGMTMFNISKLRAFDFTMPPIALIDVYGRPTLPLWEKIAANREESETLAAVRDALLPKLLSGQVRVKDAERFVEATT